MKTLTISTPSLVFTLAMSFVLSGCLKSRLQVREDSEEGAKPIPAQVQEIRPQGAYVIDELKSEITRMTGRIEDLERAKQDPQAAAAATHAQREELRKLEARIMELEATQAQLIEGFKKLQEVKASTVAESPEGFEKAKAQFDAGNYDAAIDAFSLYLKNSKAPKAEDASFYRAESYFVTKQYKKAIVDYSRFPEKYPRSRHMSVALLKIGLSFEALGMKDDAKGFYQELIEKFPKSPEAKKARTKLK